MDFSFFIVIDSITPISTRNFSSTKNKKKKTNLELLTLTGIADRFLFPLLSDGLAHAKVAGHSSSPLNPPTLPPTQEKCRPISLPTPRSESDILSSPHLKAFTYNELKNATRSFRNDSLLGEGGFGYVYKGWIDVQTLVAAKPGAGIVVAVKKLKPEGFQGHKEWLVCKLYPILML